MLSSLTHSSLKDIFENTENRHIIDFITETHFSTYCSVCYVYFTVAK